MGESKLPEGRPIVGDVIAGKYRIDGIAGEGGMGIVYEAEHVILRQRVALKALLPGTMSSPEAIQRFSVEASAIASITSDHVVRIMDAGSLANGAPYLVMEYLEGCDLSELLAQRGTLPAAEVVDIALQALEALSHAHAAHVIHRDLKPANLFVATSASGERIIKLVDFGISKAFNSNSDDHKVAGSPLYMSPEQLMNEPIDPRADLWSLGVVLYELLSGTPPFGGTFSELVGAILAKDPAPLREMVPTIAPDLAEIVAKCLKRDRALRWTTTGELAHAIAPHGTGAWNGLLERIDRALSNVVPLCKPRRFDTLDTALQALETRSERSGPSVRPLLDEVRGPKLSKVSSAEVFAATVAPPSTRKALRILLIDDSEVALAVHGQALIQAGFDVRTTISAADFEVLVDRWKPNLVLMDLEMPDASGDVLCRRLKDRFHATLPVVFLSNVAQDTLAERAKQSGADAFFQKTGDAAAFVAFVRNICAITYSPEDLP
jgi:eukaryotic-like serine/threonine-protein kinase